MHESETKLMASFGRAFRMMEAWIQADPNDLSSTNTIAE